MAEARWQLVAVNENNYVFKRSIIDEYYKNLSEQREYMRELADKTGDKYDKGYANGLDAAYTMYVE